ncbi:MAG: hypothetical protein L6Q99_12405 [Planctomycetes bacterium]|nr:hypothetical protein [Planctomycetota bacterium]
MRTHGFFLWSSLFLASFSETHAFASSASRANDEPGAQAGRDARLDALGLGALADAPLSAARAELLDLAFAAASAFPTNPHAKNKARAQAEVVDACVALDQHARAARFASEIDGWERGTAYADLAARLAERGAKQDAQRCLALAEVVAEKDRTVLEDEGGQVWRRDRIRARMARARLALGEERAAAALSDELPDAERGLVTTEIAARTDAADFDERMRWVDETVKLANFELVQAALATCVELFDAHYADVAKREACETKIESSWGKLPIGIRVEFVLDLGQRALAHGDRAKTLALASKAKALIDGAVWPPVLKVDVLSRLAKLRHRAGDVEAGRADANFALAYFDAEERAIVDIERADALRPLAETFHVLGDAATARKTYQRALEAGQTNPNARPRCQDFVATCCSLARIDFAVDEELLQTLQAIRASLREPW